MQMARERFEILESLHDMDGDKAPGPNGFTIAFFKFCWDIMEENVKQVFQEFFTHYVPNVGT